jgi:hypothetical protein
MLTCQSSQCEHFRHRRPFRGLESPKCVLTHNQGCWSVVGEKFRGMGFFSDSVLVCMLSLSVLVHHRVLSFVCLVQTLDDIDDENSLVDLVLVHSERVG